MQWKDSILVKNCKECMQPMNKKPSKYEVMDKKNLHKWKCAQSLSHVPLFAISWTVAHQILLSMVFPRQGYWSKLPFPSPRNLHSPETETVSLSSALVGRFFTTTTTWVAQALIHTCPIFQLYWIVTKGSHPGLVFEKIEKSWHLHPNSPSGGASLYKFVL